MTEDVIARWHRLVENRRPSDLDALLADDAVFLSPIVHTPQRGKTVVKAYLMAAFELLCNDSFAYVRQIQGPNDAMLEFETTIDGLTVNGVDIIQWNHEGRIVEFKVMIRPLKAIRLVHERMAMLLNKRSGGPKP